MDDLLRTTLAVDDPADEVVARSRYRLQNHMLGGGSPSPRKRIAWLSAGIAVTAAAAVAGQADDGSGAYWHVVIEVPDDTYEYWNTPDGRTWFKGRKTNGVAWEYPHRQVPAFSLFGVEVTLDQLRALPTDPAALKAWIAEALLRSDARSSKGPFDAEDQKMATFHSLISLVSTVPAPPEVRAAAFRALAAYPDVESLGEVPGGQGLLLPGDARLVVDPATGRVNRTSTYVTADGAIYGVSDPEGARISAEWTDTPPA